MVISTLVIAAQGVFSAGALWSADGPGIGLSRAASVGTPSPPTATLASDDVTVSWASATLTGGVAVDGYVVTRYDNANVAQAPGAGCAGTIAALTCVEANLPAGAWRYSVTAVKGGWSGPESAKSTTVAVVAPTLSLTSPTTTTLPRTFSGTISRFSAGSSLTFRLDSPTGTVLTGTPTTVPAGGGGSITVTIPVGVSDTTHLLYAVDGTGSSASASFSYADSPTLSTLQMFDVNSNGRIDQVVATFDEVLDTYTAGTAPWTLTSAPSGATLSSVSVSGTQATLQLTEGTGTATTAVGSFRVALTANPGGIRDLNGNQSSFAATAPADKAPPALLTLSLLDNNTNGKVDRVRAVFSETLASYSAGTAPWTLANVPSGATLSSASVSSATVTVILTEGAGGADTSVGTMTVALTTSPTGVRDAAGNRSSFAATTPIDGAKPVAVSVSDTDGTTNGLVEPGDSVSITFSEALAPASVPATVTVTETAPSSGHDTLTISGVTNGARLLGSSSYVTGTSVSANYASSTTALTNAGRTLTVTVGGACTGPACASLTAGGPGTLAYAPATTLTDGSGNQAGGTLNVASLRLF